MILTPRQIKILQMLAFGYRFQDVAKQCGVTLQTAKSHAKDIYLRPGADNNCHAVAIGLRRGIIE